MKILLQLLALFSVVGTSGGIAQNNLKVHGKARELTANSQTSDWPRVLGPTHDLHTAETNLLREWGANGPAKVWEVARGSGQATPSVAGDRLVHIFLDAGEEIVECRNAETGELFWRFSYAVQAGSSYGTPDATRCSPVIDGDFVYLLGLASDLHCLNLETGEVLWKKNLDTEFGEAPFFFSRGSSPLVSGENLIINVGSKPCVAAFNKTTGELVWGAEHAWNGSYASPVPAKIRGKDRILVFAGGMVDPPHGGLLSLDPTDGKIDDAFPWRARMFASVNAASPVVSGNRVFVTEGYTEGGAMVELSADFKMNAAWKAPRFASQFATPLIHDGHLYGFSGSSERGAELVCIEVANGKELWREDLQLQAGGRRVLLGRASMIHADDAFLCLGEQGTLLWLDLTPQGAKVISSAQLFLAPETWGTPVLSKGLLYVNRNNRDYASGEGPALICYDLRKP
ncbi:MAG: PQQ-binding-like beta-propeller repeat protein [Verrucomicrobiota bacterium]